MCTCDAGPCGFDRGSASDALNAIDVSDCYFPTMDPYCGAIRITFGSQGTVLDATVVDDTYAGTPEAACVEKRFLMACMTPFCGDPITVGKTFCFRQ